MDKEMGTAISQLIEDKQVMAEQLKLLQAQFDEVVSADVINKLKSFFRGIFYRINLLISFIISVSSTYLFILLKVYPEDTQTKIKEIGLGYLSDNPQIGFRILLIALLVVSIISWLNYLFTKKLIYINRTINTYNHDLIDLYNNFALVRKEHKKNLKAWVK
ncbi:hypothetical protein P0082_04125 [Candidatus Haliotispira prima]|uniref:Uncharacterized protein n=1 Tax=Candidatus Haliotispira prima TaxID=3034016 RepID=A0ABY8MJ63_9SPIO|nr:hypothetical protein P0082_04125 [Candidatus Haliotispira prima]